ncbi:hypothetical protein Tco_0200034 [Tanacetum coccineum]
MHQGFFKPDDDFANSRFNKDQKHHDLTFEEANKLSLVSFGQRGDLHQWSQADDEIMKDVIPNPKFMSDDEIMSMSSGDEIFVLTIDETFLGDDVAISMA